MKPSDSDGVRAGFLGYFRDRGHRLIDGVSLIPREDPTLLFINSGMAPLKAFFTGEAKPPARELTNVQSCVRTTDIDDVGDRHHLTFFEMLGSWSIGGYFKQQAIELAFGLLTGPFGFTPDELYVTVLAEDAELGLDADEESAAAWEAVGMPRDHVVPQPPADNFWGPAGVTGPCGPCTEVFLDTGDSFGPAWAPGREFDTKRRYIEIWNAGVFMQFDKAADGSLRPLPFTSVDTGSGLERVTMALNGLESVYETDLLLPVAQATQALFGDSGAIARRHRIIADHLRACCMIMSEDVWPGNEGAGYIPRRLIRRCLTTAMHAGVSRVDFAPVAESVIDRMGRHYPRLRHKRTDLITAIGAECREFEVVVRRGLDRLDATLDSTAALSGAEAFRLFATYGLPFEFTRDAAAERGIAVAAEDFQAEFRRHQELSRGLRPDAAAQATIASLLRDLPPTRFDGYSTTSGSGVVQGLLTTNRLADQAKAGETVDMVMDHTPFYAQGGGQVGDSGSVRGPDGAADIVDTTVLDSGQYVHRAVMTEGVIRVGDHVSLIVDSVRRAAIAANHSATHLLNAALREILGPHVHQAGSLVEPQRLRFDFTHPAALTPDQLRQVERLVNGWILDDHQQTLTELPLDEAKASGAISLDGENYGSGKVRVVSFDGVSRELCGGTHVSHTSVIGSMRIRSEQSVAAGVRRINAVTRYDAFELTENLQDMLAAVAAALRTSPRDVVAVAERLMSAREKNTSPADRLPPGPAVTVLTVGGVELCAGCLDADASALRAAVLDLSRRREQVAVLWSDPDGPARLAIAVAERYRPVISAVDLLRAIMTRCGGSGGGTAALAQGGGIAFAGGLSPTDLIAELLG